MLGDSCAASLFVLSFFFSCLLALFTQAKLSGDQGVIKARRDGGVVDRGPQGGGGGGGQVCSPGPPGDEVEPN